MRVFGLRRLIVGEADSGPLGGPTLIVQSAPTEKLDAREVRAFRDSLTDWLRRVGRDE